jgi:hypothetical protein
LVDEIVDSILLCAEKKLGGISASFSGLGPTVLSCRDRGFPNQAAVGVVRLFVA